MSKVEVCKKWKDYQFDDYVVNLAFAKDYFRDYEKWKLRKAKIDWNF